jgi:hypothetical protein
MASILSAALTATVSLLAFVGVPSELIAAVNVAIAAWLVVVFQLVRARVDSPATAATKDRTLAQLRDGATSAPLVTTAS